MSVLMSMAMVAFTLTTSVVNAIQQAPHPLQKTLHHSDTETKKTPSDMVFIEMDQSETDTRGSYCLDGSVPGFYYREGSTKPKHWILAFEGGEWCKTLDTCASKIESGFVDHGSSGAPGGTASAKTDFSIFKSSNFVDYNHVVFHHCDAGLWMGDKDKPSQHNGYTMYFRGKRILDHIFDYLATNTTFGTATEVLVTGGSGGGQAAFLLSDYVATLMPSSVTKYGASPMSGWYPSGEDSQERGFILHNMSGAIAPKCKNSLDESEWHTCLYSDIAYKYAKTPMFVVQLLDYNGVSRLGGDAMTAWHGCLFEEKKACTSDGLTFLHGYMDEVVDFLQSTNKYSKDNEGGFISTCTKHTVYTKDEYSNYASGDVTIDKAVQKWWSNLGSSSAAAKWYLPCELNAEYPYQCEDSCAFSSD